MKVDTFGNLNGFAQNDSSRFPVFHVRLLSGPSNSTLFRKNISKLKRYCTIKSVPAFIKLSTILRLKIPGGNAIDINTIKHHKE